MGRVGLGTRLAGLLVCCVLVCVARGQDEAPDRENRIREALFDLTAADAAARARAVTTIAELAPESIALLIRGLPDPEQHEGWAAARAAAVRIGPERVLRELEAIGSQWRGGGGPVVEQFLSEVRAQWKGAPTVVFTTATATLADPSRLPPGAATPIEDALPSDLTWGEYPVRISKKGALTIATTDPDRFDKKIPRGGWQALELGSARWPRRVMVFDRGGRWFIASSATRVATSQGVSVELLDAEGDGVFSGEDDLIAVDGRAFQRVGGTSHVWAWDVRCTIAIKRDGDDVVVELRPLPRPEGPGQNVPAWEFVNTWRAGIGLAPQALDRPRSEACKEHHDYWNRNGFSAHGQDPNKAGASRTGAVAGRSSSVWQQASPVLLAEAISRNILHRRSLIARSSEGLGLAGGPAGSLLWGGRPTRRDARAPLVIPGPGQKGVPLVVRAESPTPPDDPGFYGRTRGYPVAVHFGGSFSALSDVSLTLVTAEGGKPVTGVLFTPESPYHPNHNGQEAVFLADGALRGSTWYLARFRANDEDGEIDVSWWFSTGEGRFPKRTGRR